MLPRRSLPLVLVPSSVLQFQLPQWVANHDQFTEVLQLALSPREVVNISPDLEVVILQRKVGELGQVVSKSR